MPTRRWRCIAEPTPEERRLLAVFRYSRNEAVLHADPALMPQRRSVWSSWNYIGFAAVPTGSFP